MARGTLKIANRWSRPGLAALALALVVTPGAFPHRFPGTAQAQHAGAEQSPTPVFHGGTKQILLDFVARDKHHNVVKNLRPDEVEIFEDGVRQTPKSFEYRDGAMPEPVNAAEAAPGSTGAPGATSAAGSGTTFDPLREINIVTIVFANLGAESRIRAVHFVQEFVNAGVSPNTWIGVFTLSHQLSVLQPYTTDVALIRKAVDKAGSGDFQQFAAENVAIVKRLNTLNAAEGGSSDNPQTPATTPAQANPQAQAASAAAAESAEQFRPLQPGTAEEAGPHTGDSMLNDLLIQMNELTIATLFRQEGSRTIDALRNLVRQQSTLPGRKTVLYVSDGVVVPPDRPELLRSLISEANRGNISFYTLDPRGLDTLSSMQVATQTTHALWHSQRGDRGSLPVQQTDLQQSARELASDTGGFAMDNSNDLRAPLRRIMEDVRSHYEVTYSPPSEVYDGRFRTIEVKVTRPGVTVQSRRGYYALPMVAGKTLAPYEVAALNSLNASPIPRAFPYQSAALRFNADPGGIRYEIAFSVLSHEMKLAVDKAEKKFELHVSFVGVVRDDHGEIVQIVRRDLPFSAPLDRRAAYESGEVTATAQVHLAPGRYHLETVALDRVANSASVRRSVLIVPAENAAAPVLSDVVWVRSVAAADEDSDVFDPLESAQGKVTPELMTTFHKSDSPGFYFAAWPHQSAAAKPALTLTVVKDGKAVARLGTDTPRPDAEGAYHFEGRIPLASFEPGQYELIATVSQGATTSSTESLFAVE